METIIEPKIEIFKVEIGTATNNYYVSGTEHLTGVNELNIVSAMVQQLRNRAKTPEQLEMVEELLEAAYNGVNFSAESSTGDIEFVYDFKN